MAASKILCMSEESKKAYRDVKNSIDTAKEQGREEGLEQGRAETKVEIARNLLAAGMSANDIAKYTGLTVAEIAAKCR